MHGPGGVVQALDFMLRTSRLKNGELPGCACPVGQGGPFGCQKNEKIVITSTGFHIVR